MDVILYVVVIKYETFDVFKYYRGRSTITALKEAER